MYQRIKVHASFLTILSPTSSNHRVRKSGDIHDKWSIMFGNNVPPRSFQISLALYGHSFTCGWKAAYLNHLTRLTQLSEISLLWVPILLFQRRWWAKIVAAQMITTYTGSRTLECLCKKLIKEVYTLSPYSNPYLWTRFRKMEYGVFNFKAVTVF